MIPHALDIDRLANAMAATRGMRLVDVDPEQRSVLRVYAAAALTRLGVDAKATGRAHIAATLDGVGKSLRLAAMSLEAAGGIAEDRIAGLYRDASAAEDFAAVLLGMEPTPVTGKTGAVVLDEAAHMEEEAV